MVFAVASVTDLVDGELARRRGLVTDFGKIADPIADKALIGAALVGLSLLGELPWWVTVVILVREIGVTLLRFLVIRHGVMPASRGGKVKTLLQAVAHRAARAAARRRGCTRWRCSMMTSPWWSPWSPASTTCAARRAAAPHQRARRARSGPGAPSARP